MASYMKPKVIGSVRYGVKKYAGSYRPCVETTNNVDINVLNKYKFSVAGSWSETAHISNIDEFTTTLSDEVGNEYTTVESYDNG